MCLRILVCFLQVCQYKRGKDDDSGAKKWQGKKCMWHQQSQSRLCQEALKPCNCCFDCTWLTSVLLLASKQQINLKHTKKRGQQMEQTQQPKARHQSVKETRCLQRLEGWQCFPREPESHVIQGQVLFRQETPQRSSCRGLL